MLILYFLLQYSKVPYGNSGRCFAFGKSAERISTTINDDDDGEDDNVVETSRYSGISSSRTSTVRVPECRSTRRIPHARAG